MLNPLQKFFGQSATHRKPEAGALLLGVFGSSADRIAVRLAERLAESRPFHLARLQDVPRNESLPGGVAELENEEKHRLHLNRTQCANLKLACCRHPGQKLLEMAQAVSPGLLIVAQSLPADESQRAVLRWIFRESPANLLFIQVGSPGAEDLPLPSRLLLSTPRGTVWPKEVLAEAAKLAGTHGTVEIVGILNVPRALCRDASLPAEENQLDGEVRAASLILQKMGASVQSRTVRARETQEAILRLLQKEASLPSMVLELAEGSDPESALNLDGGTFPGIRLTRWKHST